MRWTETKQGTEARAATLGPRRLAAFIFFLAAAVWVPGLLAASSPTGQFTVSGGVVTDTATGLQWQEGTSPDDVDWPAAIAYCQSLSLDGGGWRLPSMKEIQTIVAEGQSNPALDASIFSEGAGMRFWSSSQQPDRSDMAWLLDSNIGHVYTQDTIMDIGIRARCVR